MTLGAREDALPEEVIQTAKALTPGQLSPVVTAGGQSFLLLGLELDEDAAARALFDQRLTERAEQAEVKLLAAYEDIDPGKFYPALTAAQAALDANSEAGASPSGSALAPSASG